MLPRLTGSVDANRIEVTSYSFAVVWCGLQTAALVLRGRRGLWLLLGLPIVLYWPIGFKLLEYACRHDVNACL